MVTNSIRTLVLVPEVVLVRQIRCEVRVLKYIIYPKPEVVGLAILAYMVPKIVFRQLVDCGREFKQIRCTCAVVKIKCPRGVTTLKTGFPEF